jgi:hypothetical protein
MGTGLLGTVVLAAGPTVPAVGAEEHMALVEAQNRNSSWTMVRVSVRWIPGWVSELCFTA